MPAVAKAGGELSTSFIASGANENDPLLDDAELKAAICDENVNAPQLTLKALVAGVLAGTFGSFVAIYNGLRTGIVPSLNIISALLGYFICKAIVSSAGGIFTPQENVVIQTTAVACIQVASSSGFSSGLLAMGKQAATVDGVGQNHDDYINLTYTTCFAFCVSVAFFGFWIAFPLRKYCIIDRKLQFPSGTATAKLIQTMHSKPAEAKASLVKLVQWSGISFAQSIFCFFVEGFSSTPLGPLAKYGYSFDWDLNSLGIGMILPNTINASILVGGVIASTFIAPWVISNHECPFGTDPNTESCWYILGDQSNMTSSESYAASYLGSRAYYFYPGCTMVVVDGFYSIVKLIIVLGQGFFKASDVDAEDNETTEGATRKKLTELFLESRFPSWMVAGGYCVSALVSLVVMTTVFGMQWYEVLLAVILTPVFSVGIIVGVGMTDWDVSSSFGKLMMIPFGALAHAQTPPSLIPPLAACMITIAGCGAAAGLMQDFKTGYLLGANPRTMFISQIVGATAGCFAAPAMFEIFNQAYTLPGNPDTQAIPGIFGTSYRVLAGVFTAGGLGSLPDHSLMFCLVFGLLALGLNLLGEVAPQSVIPYIPNAMAMSIGMMFGSPGVGIDFLLGGVAISIWRCINPERAEKFYIVVACGCLAGGAVGQLAIIVLQAFGAEGVNWPVWPAAWA